MNDAQCASCGRTWLRDPRLEVNCPACNAHVGQPCLYSDGRTMPVNGFHSDRYNVALRLDKLPHCPAMESAPFPVPGQLAPCEPWTNQESLFV